MSIEGLSEITDRVYRLEFASGQSAHSGIVIGDDAVAVVDTCTFEDDARILLDAVASLTELPIRYVVNTHHHGDHTFGNWLFRPAAIVGHERVRAWLVGDAGETHREMMGKWMPASKERMQTVVVDPPDVTFEERMKLHLGGVTLRLDYFGRAHTDNDIAIGVEEASICFAGDMIGEPLFCEDAFPAEWGPTLRGLEAVPEATFASGHDPLVDRAYIGRQAALAEELAASCAAGTPLEQIVADASPEMQAVFGHQLATAVERYGVTAG
jgi:glyoxylase-like metal-dependent hydrolase (beta-lactamase superfamily II)